MVLPLDLAVLLILLMPIALEGAEGQKVTAATKSSHAMLSGRVIFHGSSPEEEWVPVYKHRTFCGDKRPLGQYRVAPSGGVENVAVLLETDVDILSGMTSEKAAVFLDNQDCEFVPRVQVAPPSAALEVRNRDPILHSAHAFQEDGNTAFHVALPHFRDRTRTRVPQSGLLRIVCDVGHTWMRAYILISSTPFSAVTGPEGAFEIRGIPPGRYRLRAWHEAFGVIERKISIAKDDHPTLTLIFGSKNVR